MTSPTLTLRTDPSAQAPTGAVETKSLPDAAGLLSAIPRTDWVFDLSTRAHLDWPVHVVDLPDARLATNQIAGLLALAAERVLLAGPGGVVELTGPWDSAGEAEVAIYTAASQWAGAAWTLGLAETARQVHYARQQRLELLHCIALSLCEASETHALGRMLDQAITGLALPTLKATGRPTLEAAYDAA